MLKPVDATVVRTLLRLYAERIAEQPKRECLCLMFDKRKLRTSKSHRLRTLKKFSQMPGLIVSTDTINFQNVLTPRKPVMPANDSL